eukprot:3558260-Pyramimonas_sp.AAC.1
MTGGSPYERSKNDGATQIVAVAPHSDCSNLGVAFCDAVFVLTVGEALVVFSCSAAPRSTRNCARTCFSVG